MILLKLNNYWLNKKDSLTTVFLVDASTAALRWINSIFFFPWHPKHFSASDTRCRPRPTWASCCAVAVDHESAAAEPDRGRGSCRGPRWAAEQQGATDRSVSPGHRRPSGPALLSAARTWQEERGRRTISHRLISNCFICNNTSYSRSEL